MTTTTLILGGTGMLGRAVLAALAARGRPALAPPRAQADLLRPESLAPLLDRGATVINCAAWTDVDAAEAAEPDASRVNGHAVADLAELCRDRGARLVHYSTDYVFAGDASAPYPIDAPINPLNAYGRGKALGEAAIADAASRGLDALVLRTSWLYAPWGKNFVRTIAAAARQRPSLKVVDDQHGRPTSSEHLADLTLRLLDARARGVLHAADGGQTTWHGFASRIAAHANPLCPVHPCTSAEFPRPARRPAYSVLDLSATEAILGPLTPWQTNLDAVLPRLAP